MQQQQQQDALQGALSQQLQALLERAEAGEEHLDPALAQQMCDALGAGADEQQLAPDLLARLAWQLLARLEHLLPPAPGDAAPVDADRLAAVAAALSSVTQRLQDASAPPAAAAASEQLAASALLPALVQALERVGAAVMTDEGQLAEAASRAPAGWLTVARSLVALTHAVLGAWPCRGGSGDSGSTGDSGGDSSSTAGDSGGGALACSAAAPLAVPYARLLAGLLLLEAQQLAPDTGAADSAPQVAAATAAAHVLHCAARLAALVADARDHSSLRQYRQAYELGEQPELSPPFLRALANHPFYLRLLLSMLVSTLDASGGSGSSVASSVGAGGSSSSDSGAPPSSSTQQQMQPSAAPYLSQLAGRLGLPPTLVELWRRTAAEAGPQALQARQLHAELRAVVSDMGGALGWRYSSDDERAMLLLQLQLLAPVPMLLLTLVAGWLGDAHEPAGSAAVSMDAVESAVGITRRYMPLSAESRLHLVAPLHSVLQLSLHILERAVARWGGAGGAEADAAARRAAHCVVLPLLQLLTSLSEVAAHGTADEHAAWQGVAARLAAAFEAAMRRAAFPYMGTFESALCCVQSLAVQIPKTWVDAPRDSSPPPLLSWAAAAPAAGGPEQASLFGLFISSLKALACRPELGLGQESSPCGCWCHWAGAALHMAAASRAASAGGGDVGGSSSSGGVPWLALYAHLVYRTTCQFEEYLRMVFAAAPNQRWLMKACAALLEDLAAMLQRCCSEDTDTSSAAAAASLWAGAPAPLPQLLAVLQQQLLPAVSRAGRMLVLARMVLTSHRQHRGAPTPADLNYALFMGSTFGEDRCPAADAAMTPEMAAVVVASGSAGEVLRVLQSSPLATSLLQQLRDWAAGVCAALPHRFACNNPGCTSLAGESESALVGGRRNVCAGCLTARYCTAECQAAHWRHHKPVCRRLKREAAAAATAAPE